MSALESRREAILLVEDDDDHAALAQSALARQWAVSAVRSGRDALAILTGGHHFAAVVLDYALPDMSAIEVLHSLGATFDAPVVIVSASDAVPVVVGVMKAGAADYLVKDASFSANLPLAVAEAIDRRRASAEPRDVDRHVALYRDYITGLLNRRRFEELYGETLERAASTNENVAVAMLDIDGFKRINDRHGHLAGDHALAAIGNVIRGAVWGSDIAARYGGDEIVLVMPETDLERAQVVMRRIERRLDALNESQRLPESLALSIGLAADDKEHGTLLARADAALYAAKRQRRRAATRVVVEARAPRRRRSAAVVDSSHS